MAWMRKLRLLTLMVVAVCGVVQADKPQEDKTLSPFFFVETDDPELDQLPLKAVSAVVNISGVIADVTIEQMYTNEGSKTLEATYVFPASTRAAVYGMSMTIGDRRVVAEIREKEEAREIYEEAVEAGQTASLLEQSRPNVFQMQLGNILPGDTIVVELKYTEHLVPTEGVYEFVYPTVVGPRYSEIPMSEAQPEDLFLASPYTHEGEPPLYTFDIDVNINAGLPLQYVRCTSHAVITNFITADRALVELDPSEIYGGNKDYILQYGLSGEDIGTGLLLYRGETENFFLFMGQPPERIEEEQIPPREYVFIMDVSGSMWGFPIEVSKSLLRDLIGSLRPVDMFNVVMFAGGSTVLSPVSVAAIQQNIDWAINVIETQTGGGGTRILNALHTSMNLPRPDELTSRTFVIATDGYVAVEKEVFTYIREHLNQANVFAFGIGSAPNRYIIEGMARAGMGEAFIVTNEDEAPEIAARFRQYVKTPVLTQASFDPGTFDVYDIEPISIPDILAERPVTIFGKWRGSPQGTVKLIGKTAQGNYETSVDAGSIMPTETNAALRYLWARQRIAVLGDYASLGATDSLKIAITELGLTYNLLTAYTSFIAVDKEIRNVDGELVEVEVPLPMPDGVSDYAIGTELSYGTTGMTTASPTTADMSSMAPSAIETATWLGKTFYLDNGVWIDITYTPGTSLIEYDIDSELPADIAPYASLQQSMIIVVNGQAYKLRAARAENMPILIQNAPNPFNAETSLRFALSNDGAPHDVSITVYDVTGRQVRTFKRTGLMSGVYSVTWDGRDELGRAVSSGVYIYRMTTGKHSRARSMVLLR